MVSLGALTTGRRLRPPVSLAVTDCLLMPTFGDAADADGAADGVGDDMKSR